MDRDLDESRVEDGQETAGQSLHLPVVQGAVAVSSWQNGSSAPGTRPHVRAQPAPARDVEQPASISPAARSATLR